MRSTNGRWLERGTAFALSVGVLVVPETVGDPCAQNAYYKVCASWDSGTPFEGTDFNVSFNGSNPPSVLLRNPRLDWKIVVTNPGGSAPASLATLTTEDDGDYTVSLVGSGSTPGAVNVDLIDLTPNGNYKTSIGTMIISGDLGGLTVQAYAGQGGNVDRLEVGDDLTGDVFIANDLGVFVLEGVIDSAVTFYATLLDGASGVTLASGLAAGATLEFQEVASGAKIDILGELAGDIIVSNAIESGDMDGEISVESGSLTGEISISGDLGGVIKVALDIEGTVTVAGDMTGTARILADRSFVEGSAITVVGSKDGTAGIAADYDGWQSGHEWECGAIVSVSTVEYEYNSPGVNVYHITQCRGDLNGDCVVNFFDADPFALALSDPEQYALDFPGLEGSRVYHGDCSQSDGFNNYDIDPFVAIVIAGCSSGECTPCGMDPEELYTAADAASILTTYIAEIRWGAVRAIVADVAATHPRSARRIFWADVLELLEAR